MSSKSQNRFTKEQWISLIAGCLTMMVQGSLYVFGTITPYIASYLYYEGETNIQMNDLQIIVTISVLCVNMGMVLPKFQLFAFSNRIMALISILGVAGSVFVVSFISSFGLYVLIYGFFFGAFIGYGYVAPLKNCIQHIPKKKGLCSGVCIMGFGVGALFFNLILLQLINPDNVEFDHATHRFPKQIAYNLPSALRIISSVYLILGLIAVSLIRKVKHEQKRSENTQSLLGQENESESNEVNKKIIEAVEQISLKQMLLKKRMIFCMAIIASTMPFAGFVAFYYKEYGMTKINDDRFLTILGSVASIVNGLARLFFGTLMDKISFKAITTAINIIFIMACSTIYFAVQNKYTYLIVVLFAYCCYAGNYSVYPIQTVRILGAENGGKYYWVTFTGFGIGAVVQFVLHYTLVNQFHEQGFVYCFIIFGILLLGGTGLAWWVKFEFHPSELQYIKGMDLEGHNYLTNNKQIEKASA